MLFLFQAKGIDKIQVCDWKKSFDEKEEWFSVILARCSLLSVIYLKQSNFFIQNFIKMKQSEVIKRLVEKSWADPTFKKAFIADPVAAIEAETGTKITLPEGKKLVVMDQSNFDNYYLNLSRYVYNQGWSDKELSDSQLEAVAGGAPSAEDCPDKDWWLDETPLEGPKS